jgi:hypothetical protein
MTAVTVPVALTFVGRDEGHTGGMVDQRGPHLDDTLGLLLGGYAWLPRFEGV